MTEGVSREAGRPLGERPGAGPAGGADSRVTKYEHRLQEVFNFDRREIAVICVLLLRGPQTPGELRGRSERMYHFETLDDVQSTIQRLSDLQPPLVRVLPRQPGTKESRYVHLFVEDTWPTEAYPPHLAPEPRAPNDSSRLPALEPAVSSLKKAIVELNQHLP